MDYTGRLHPKGLHFQASGKWKGIGISLVEGEVVTDQLINKVQIQNGWGLVECQQVLLVSRP